jgi:ATP-dependent Lon protease
VRQELVAPAKYKLERLINIKEGERGHDYRLIFGPYLKGAQEIILREPYLENVNQCHNLRDFLELAWSQSRKLKRVTLVTKNELRGKYPGVRSSLIRLAQDLNKKGVRLETRYDNYIHDRLLKIDSQWEIGLSRGLDIFYTHHGRGLGNSQQALRACRETRITVLQSVKA